MLNFWEEFAVTIVSGLVRHLVHNPAKLAGVRNILLHLADDIYTVFGITPPPHD